MASSDLQTYITGLRAKNISDEVIKTQLLRSGWSEKDLLAAFTTDQADITLPPPPVPHFSMWVTFEYIILFLSMYVCFTALGGILHFAVDHYLPATPSDSGTMSYLSSSLSSIFLPGYMASIIITFPIFALLFIHVNHAAIANPGIKNIRSRKILIYLTLVIAFIYMISHLITTLYGFFQGTSTSATILHLVVNLLVAGSIFGYLIFGIRGDRKSND